MGYGRLSIWTPESVHAHARRLIEGMPGKKSVTGEKPNPTPAKGKNPPAFPHGTVQIKFSNGTVVVETPNHGNLRHLLRQTRFGNPQATVMHSLTTEPQAQEIADALKNAGFKVMIRPLPLDVL